MNADDAVNSKWSLSDRAFLLQCDCIVCVHRTEGLMHLFQIRDGNPNTCHAIIHDHVQTVRNETG